jgi:hypothetical protein
MIRIVNGKKKSVLTDVQRWILGRELHTGMRCAGNRSGASDRGIDIIQVIGISRRVCKRGFDRFQTAATETKSPTDIKRRIYGFQSHSYTRLSLRRIDRYWPT